MTFLKCMKIIAFTTRFAEAVKLITWLPKYMDQSRVVKLMSIMFSLLKTKRDQLLVLWDQDGQFFTSKMILRKAANCLFQWMGSTPKDDFNFTVKVFNKDGIALHGETKHHCSRTNHQHRKRRPHYKKQFEYHVLQTHSLVFTYPLLIQLILLIILDLSVIT